jgi:hypothetical protein
VLSTVSFAAAGCALLVPLDGHDPADTAGVDAASADRAVPLADAETTSDRAVTAPDASDAGTTGGCPRPTPANSVCWDFDDGLAPAGTLQGGQFIVEPSTAWSSPNSLRVQTLPITQGGEAWAWFGNVWARPPRVIDFSERIRLDSVTRVYIEELRITGRDAIRYELFMVVEAGSAQVMERIVENGSASEFSAYAIGGISATEWTQLALHVELVGVPGTLAQRKLVVRVNGEPKVDNLRTAGLDRIASAEQTSLRLGVSYVDGDEARPAQTLRIDDAQITWTP